MNKLFTKIATLSVGLFMAIGVGVTFGSKNAKVERAEAAGETYSLIKDIADLSDGDSIIIGNGTSGTVKFLSTTQNSNNRGATSGSSVSSGNVSLPSGAEVLTLGSSGSNWTLHATTTSGYLYAASSSSNQLKTRANNSDGNSEWSISITTAGVASITEQGSNTRNQLKHNSSSALFACYSSGQAAVSIYKLQQTGSYTVSFNGNGGSGSMSPISDVSGTYTLPSNGFGAPSGQAFAGWKANNAGDLLAAGADYKMEGDVTFYAQWATAYTVTYEAGPNGSGSYSHANQPAGDYSLLPFASLSGISASSGYRIKNYTVGGVDKNPNDTITLSAATTVTVNFEAIPLEGTYDFVTNFATYAKDWGGYAPHSVTGTELGSSYEASISFTNVSKQSTGTAAFTDRPVVAAKSGVTSTMLFQLDGSVSSEYNITSVAVTFRQWNSKKVGASLYKGASVSGSALDSFTESETPRVLSVANLNSDAFIVDFTSTNTSNVQIGITSIIIGLAKKAAFGTLDHISVTGLPNTIYHVGENYDASGLKVTAYDNADESIAVYKDVTSSVTTSLINGYQFKDSDVPTVVNTIGYEESSVAVQTSFNVSVYALAEYELLTSEPTDWSGNYLIVASYTDSSTVSHTVAINSALTNFDQPLNFKEVSVSDNKISTGQELEWTVASYSGGYSMQGKNGKYAYGQDGNRFMTSDSPKQLSLAFASNIVTVTGATGYTLRMNASAAGAERFGFYNTGSADISFYKLKTSSKADEYAQTFLGAITCDASGEEEPSFTIKEGSTYWSWALLSEEYDTLTPAEKEQFRLGVASQTGDNIAQALAKYDYIVGKYNKGLGMTEKYPDFMLRDPDPISKSSVMPFGSETEANNTAIIVIVSISAISVLSIAVLLTLKKRKLR